MYSSIYGCSRYIHNGQLISQYVNQLAHVKSYFKTQLTVNNMSINELIGKLKRSFAEGFIVLVPLIITILVLSVGFNFLLGAVSPIASVIESLVGVESLPEIAIQIITLGVMFLIILIVGIGCEAIVTVRELTDIFHALVEKIPGIGTVYNSFRKMSETMSQGEDSFRDVKLVEYPSDGCYSIAFLTSGNNSTIEDAVGSETETLFIPMAPNPFMGGFVVNMSKDRIYEVDMTVKEGIKNVVTSGVTMGEEGRTEEELNLDDEIDELIGRYHK